MTPVWQLEALTLQENLSLGQKFNYGLCAAMKYPLCVVLCIQKLQPFILLPIGYEAGFFRKKSAAI